jgi:hypothetical protein
MPDRAGAIKSVVGSIGIGKSGAGLAQADAAIRRLFSPSGTARRARRRKRSRG